MPGDRLFALTESDHEALSRLLIAFESGRLFRSSHRAEPSGPRMFEPFQYYNGSGATIPAYGAFWLDTATTVSGYSFPTAKRPDSTFRRLYGVNVSGEDVHDQTVGWGTRLGDDDYVLTNGTLGSDPGPGKVFSAVVDGFNVTLGLAGGFLSTGGILDAGLSTERILAVQYIPHEVVGVITSSCQHGATVTVTTAGGGFTSPPAMVTGAAIANCYNRGCYLYANTLVRVVWEDNFPIVYSISHDNCVLGKLRADCARGSSASVRVYRDTTTGDTGDNITAFNAGDGDRLNGDWVLAKFVTGPDRTPGEIGYVFG